MWVRPADLGCPRHRQAKSRLAQQREKYEEREEENRKKRQISCFVFILVPSQMGFVFLTKRYIWTWFTVSLQLKVDLIFFASHLERLRSGHNTNRIIKLKTLFMFSQACLLKGTKDAFHDNFSCLF